MKRFYRNLYKSATCHW